MPVVEVSLPEDVYAEFERAVDEEFMSEERAVEELLGLGVDAYRSEPDSDEEEISSRFAGAEGNLWDTADDRSFEDDTL
ncbi:MAG: hypothetical protein ABEJ28_09340 [Salinigranum sp.]